MLTNVNRTSTKDPLGRLNYFYFDTLNRLVASEDGLQKRTYFEYDAVGNTVSTKNPRRASTSPAEVGIRYFTFDELDRRTSLKDEVGQVWYFDYDAVSNQFVQRNPRAALTYFEFDADNRKVSQKDPLARTWYWTYDAVGNASSLKDGKAQVTYYQHDSVNLQDRIDYPDGTKHYFEYDLVRQTTAMTDATGRTTMGYDNLGRMTFRGNPGGQNLYYEYDAVGNRTSMKDPDGVTVYHTYDAANRLDDVSSATYAGRISYYQYDLADQMVHETRANGAVTYHGYDAAGRLSLIQHRKSAGTLIEQYDYTRDEAGNVLLQLRGSDSTSVYWNYDQAGRITKEAWRTIGGTNLYGFEYAYDEAGNRQFRKDTVKATTTYWEYDLADQMTLQRSGAPVTVYFTFDDNGNLSVEHDVDPSAGRTYYDYEPRNLLSRVDFPGGTATNYFTYNAPGERVRKDDSTGGKKYTWDGIVQVLEKDLTNSTLQRLVKGYTPVEGIGEYTMQDVANAVIYPHKNQVGTTVRHTDSGQAVANYYEYDAWGRPFETNQSTAQQYRFTGKELDPDFIALNSDNERYCLPSRVYLPAIGNFVQSRQRSPLHSNSDHGPKHPGSRTSLFSTDIGSYLFPYIIAHSMPCQDGPLKKCCCCVDYLHFDEDSVGKGKHPDDPSKQTYKAMHFEIEFAVWWKVAGKGEPEGNCRLEWKERQKPSPGAAYGNWKSMDGSGTEWTFKAWKDRVLNHPPGLCPDFVLDKFKDSPGMRSRNPFHRDFNNRNIQTQIDVTIFSTPGCMCQFLWKEVSLVVTVVTDELGDETKDSKVEELYSKDGKNPNWPGKR